jgi:GntR family transcriptional regulator
VYTVSLLPKSLTPKLEAIPLHRLEKIPLYIILEESYSLPTRRTDELFGVAHADQEQARVLDVERGKALLRIDSVIYTYGNKPFEYRNAYCVTDSKMVYRTM